MESQWVAARWRARVALAFLAMGFLAVTIAWVGGPSQPLQAAGEAAPVDPADLPPIFVDWPEAAPDLALVITGEMYGYLRPCGCSPGQHGGLARRGGFLKYLKETRHWPVMPIDLGDLIKGSGQMERTRYDYALRSLQKLEYPAIAVGAKDLAITASEVVGQGLNTVGDTHLIGANLSHEDAGFAELLPEGIRPGIEKTVGTVKVAVAAAMNAKEKENILDPQVVVKDMDGTVKAIAASMKKLNADIKVLLAYTDFAEAKALAAKYPDFDVIVCKSDLEDAADRDAVYVGKTLITWVGRKGKAAGVIGFWKDQAEPKARLRFTMIPLDTRFDEMQEMQDIYNQFITAIKQEGYLEKMFRATLPDGNGYIGSESCGECHTKAYAHWKGTGHAHALVTLNDIKPVNTQNWNVECVGCHVVGLGYKSGFETPTKTPHLAGVGCESCHGPGKLHAEADDPTEPKLLASVRVTKEQSKNRIAGQAGACVTCHDAENSINFNFETYWPKVEHPWSD